MNGKAENEKSLLINEWTGNFQSFELINVAIQKNNCGRVLFLKTYSPVLEMIFFWKQTSSQLLKFADIFQRSFPQEHEPVSSFSQHDKLITCERNAIDFGGYFIYSGNFMNRQYQASDMQIRKCKNITSKQPLNWIRLIQVGNIQDCFVDLKLYCSLSKLIQSLFESVFIQLATYNSLNQPFCQSRVDSQSKGNIQLYCHSNKKC